MTIPSAASVQSIARQIAESRNLSLCPVLADALEESGYENRDDLSELRAEQVYSRKPIAEEVGRVLAEILSVTVVRLADEDNRPGHARRRTRTVDVEKAVEDVIHRAIVRSLSYTARHGGTVANKYAYPAVTEGVFAAAIYDAATNTVRVKAWAGELPANKTSYAGVAAIAGYRDLLDERMGEARTAAAKQALRAELAGE